MPAANPLVLAVTENGAVAAPGGDMSIAQGELPEQVVVVVKANSGEKMLEVTVTEKLFGVPMVIA